MQAHDESKRQGSKGFSFAGPGMAHTFKCSKCDQPKRTAGRVMRVKGHPALGYVRRGCREN